MMPTFLGEPFYPGGIPMRPDQIHLQNGETLQEIILKYYEGEATTEEKDIIKEYVIYHIAAPIFIFEYENSVEEKIFKSLPLDDMLDILLDAGLDPI